MLAFYATFPFIIYSTFLFGGTGSRSLNMVILGSVLGVVLGGRLLLQKGRGIELAWSPALLALGLYFIAMVLAGLLGMNFSTTFWSMATRTTGIWYFLSLGIFMLMLWPIVSNELKRDRLILVTVCASALYSVLYLMGPEGFGWLFAGYRINALTFGNTSFAAMYLFGAFILALYYVAQANRKTWWMYVLPVLIVINPALFHGYVWRGDISHGFLGEAKASSIVVWLSLASLGVVWAISKLKSAQVRERVSLGLFMVGVIAAVGASVSLLTPGGLVRSAYLGTSTAARPLVWEISERAIAERPWFGWGGDNFERVFEQHFDNRLLQENYGNEAWFDRAHNVYIDQLVDNGIVGLGLYLLVYAVLAGTLLYVALRAKGRNDALLASLLLIYFGLHLAELQTAFDTSISYPMLGLTFVLAGTLFHRTWYTDGGGLWRIPSSAGYVTAFVLIGFFSWSLFAGVLPLTRAQWANGQVRSVRSSDKRLALYPTLFASPLDRQAFLWRTSTDFQRGIAQDPSVIEDPKKVALLAREMEVFEAGYKTYLIEHPENFRAHLNLADVLMYQSLFGKSKLGEAREVLVKAQKLSPESPHPYWMLAVSYVYEGKFVEARKMAKVGLELNPQVLQSQKIVEYVEKQSKNFPEIDMYFFTQI